MGKNKQEALSLKPALTFKQRLSHRNTQKILVIITFSFIPLLLLLLFTYIPFIRMFSFSLYEMKYIGPKTFVVWTTILLCSPEKTASAL
jgi:ABC-type sugar transport system permease subunit